MSKRVAVVGSGAVGGYVGARLTRAGIDVTLIDAWPDHVETMRRDGLRVSEMKAEDSFSVPVRVFHITDVQALNKEAPIDIALVSVKSYDTEWATALILPYLAADGFVVSVQNGINEDRIAAVAGWGRTMGCSVSVHAGELVGPGHVVRTSPRGDERRIGLRVGEPHGRITPRLEMIVGLLGHVDTSKATSNLWGERWSKLVINSMRNGVSAMTGMSGKERDLDDEIRLLTIRLGSQAVRVGQALGLALEDVGGLDLQVLVRAGGGDPEALGKISEQIIRVAHSRTDDQRPSMGQDVRKGRRTETDFINGLVARKGEEVGVDASLHARVNEIIKKVERGEIRPSPATARGL